MFRYKKPLIIVLVPVILFTVFCLFFRLPDRVINKDYSRIIYDRNGNVLRVFCSTDEKWRLETDIDKVSPYLKNYIINYEDKLFYYHFGVNPVSLLRAFKSNVKAGRIVQGGSTITMQLVKVLFPRKRRSYFSKIKEVFLASVIEFKYSKEEILELYINFAPYGGNIEGVAAASLIYFGKSAGEISPGEAAILTMLPKSPTRYRPDRNRAVAIKNRDKVLGILRGRGVISRADYREALKEQVNCERKVPPIIAPHFTDWVAAQSHNSNVINTTLDSAIQHMCEQMVSGHMKELSGRSISNCAVVVMENLTGEIIAMVGSKDFYDVKSQGQVNGATSPRSPGSLLKPFLYALAMDKGILTPKTVIPDVPVSYSGYCPANYDEVYHGLITTHDALRYSMNVPAVNISARLRGKGVYEVLRKAKIGSINRPYNSYGLPIILGACEISLLDMVSLYSGIANYGLYHRPRYIKGKKEIKEPVKLFSDGASWLVTEILTDVTRPDLPDSWESTMHLPRVAWKTGTSYGHKDAWSIGYNPAYTVGVWVGNFDGHGVYNLSGASCATPLLFRIFNNLYQERNVAWFYKPHVVKEREVCALTGMCVNAHCPYKVKDYYLVDHSPSKECDVHCSLFIDKKTGTMLCPHCKQGRQCRNAVYEKWPAEMATLLKETGYPIQNMPSHYNGCDYVKCGEDPAIVSPEENCVYYLGKYLNKDYQNILLMASVQNNVKKVYWYIDGDLIHEGSPDEKYFYSPEQGIHEILVMDDEGRTDTRELVVN